MKTNELTSDQEVERDEQAFRRRIDTREVIRTLRPIIEKHIANRLPLDIYVNRHGELNWVTFSNAELEWEDGENVIDLHDDGAFMRLRVKRGNEPSFDVAYVMEGTLSSDGDPISIADLPRAIESAKAERIRFYSEREEVYGESAWPITA